MFIASHTFKEHDVKLKNSQYKTFVKVRNDLNIVLKMLFVHDLNILVTG